MKDIKLLNTRLHSLVIFRGILKDKVINRFAQFNYDGKSKEEAIELYAQFVSSLYDHTDNFSRYVLNCVLEDENTYITHAGTKVITENYKRALACELATLEELCSVTSDDVKKFLRIGDDLPDWSVEDVKLAETYTNRIEHISEYGYGIWAKYHMFSLKDGQIVPVKYPDPQRLSDFSGYESERNKVILNTKALLNSEPCNNVLLYGDAGSGKSSTVKAIANEFKNDGLRLIEVKKNQLYSLPDVMDKLSANPLKFIIFIDDLSFAKDDADFGALKAILEGSTSGRSQNVAIYATSNRRHLVKESFADREGDDLHIQDTIQELTSLSARFGLKVTFSKPDKNLYTSIVTDLAKQYGIDMPEEELIIKAEAHAIRNGGRSPRTAKQFIEYISYTEKEKVQ